MSQQRKSPSPPIAQRLEEDGCHPRRPVIPSTSRIAMSTPANRGAGYTESDGCHVEPVRQHWSNTTSCRPSEKESVMTRLSRNCIRPEDSIASTAPASNDSNIKSRINRQKTEAIKIGNNNSFSYSGLSEEVNRLSIQDTVSCIFDNHKRVQAAPPGHNNSQLQSPGYHSVVSETKPKSVEVSPVVVVPVVGRSIVCLPEAVAAIQQQPQVSNNLMVMRGFEQRHNNNSNEQMQRQDETSNDSKAAFDAMLESDEEGDTILHRVIISERHDLILKLIRLAAEVKCLDLKNKLQQTSLHLATIMQQPLVIRQLVMHGAKVKVFDRRGNTPLHIACEKGYYDCLVALTENRNVSGMESSVAAATEELKSTLSSANYKGETCLHIAASAPRNQRQIIEHLVRNCGVDVNQKELSRGRTILHRAVEMQNCEFLQFILNFSSLYLDAPMYDDFTALQIARMNNQTHIAHLLLSFGAEDIIIPPQPMDIDAD